MIFTNDIFCGLITNFAFILIFLMAANYHELNQEIDNEQKGENRNGQDQV